MAGGAMVAVLYDPKCSSVAGGSDGPSLSEIDGYFV